MKKNKKTSRLIRYLIPIVLGLSIITGYWFYTDGNLNKNPQELAYKDFIAMLEEGKVQEIELDRTADTFVLEVEDGTQYEVSNPKTEDFKEKVLLSGVKVEEVHKKEIPWLSLISVFTSVIMVVFFVRYISGTSKKGSFKADMNSIKNTNITLSDIAGINEVKKDVKFLIRFLKEPQYFHERGAKMPRGVLLYGDPGTGKTMLAKAIAGEAGVPFYNISGSDFVEMFVGVGAKRVRELFETAKKNTPCVVFIDELDAVGRKRGADRNSEKDQTINALLTEMDGFSSRDGILVLAATNRLEDLDPALIRSGRFDKHIKVPLPITKEERLAIMNIHKGNKKFDETVDFDRIARMTSGFSGADLANLLNESVLESIIADKEQVDMASVEKAYYKIVMEGHQRDHIDPTKTEEEIKLVAVHEAGHALVARKLCKESVPMVSIVGTTTGAGGFTVNLPDDVGVLTEQRLIEKVMTLYAGRCSEEIFGYGKTTGASNDIERATYIIKGMVTKFGMYGAPINSVVIAGSEEVDETDKKAIEILAQKIYEQSMEYLKENKETLEEIANLLIEKEKIDEVDLDKIISKKDGE